MATKTWLKKLEKYKPFISEQVTCLLGRQESRPVTEIAIDTGKFAGLRTNKANWKWSKKRWQESMSTF